MRLLVIGAGGQVGDAVARRAMAAGHAVIGTHQTRTPTDVPSEPLDKSDEGAVHRLVGRVHPDAIVDTAALHNVDFCEQHPDDARRVNVEGTRIVAAASAAVGARFVFVSTDFVFDGRGSPPYDETEPTHPLSVYAASKVEGERAALASGSASIVVRPSVIYSWVSPDRRGSSASGKPLNFAAWLVDQLVGQRATRIVTDQIASPTLADDLAGAILALIDAKASGVFHTAGATSLSRYEFAVRLGHRLGLDTRLVTPITTADLQQVAPRPLNSSLRSTRLRSASGYAMMPIAAALDSFAKEFQSAPPPGFTPGTS